MPLSRGVEERPSWALSQVSLEYKLLEGGGIDLHLFGQSIFGQVSDIHNLYDSD